MTLVLDWVHKMDSQAHNLRRVFDSASQRDVLLDSDGKQIPLNDGGYATHLKSPTMKWEEAELPEGFYWWVRLRNNDPECIELIECVQVGGACIPSITRFEINKDHTVAAVLMECARYATVPIELKRVVVATL